MRVVIVVNGVMVDPEAEFTRWVESNTVVVGADGGTKHVLGCGFYPQHVIGDMDSITPEVRADLQAHNVTFHTHPPDKDETDLELALIWAAHHYPNAEIVILGAMGGRPDQALANLLLLALPELEGMDVVLVEGNWLVRVIHGGETRTFTGSIDDTLSLIPLGGDAAGVTTSGLKYLLNDETLRFGPARGVSNVFEEERISVSVEEGMLWGVQERIGTKE
jgi:thiamine pyrophosphokinase